MISHYSLFIQYTIIVQCIFKQLSNGASFLLGLLHLGAVLVLLLDGEGQVVESVADLLALGIV